MKSPLFRRLVRIAKLADKQNRFKLNQQQTLELYEALRSPTLERRSFLQGLLGATAGYTLLGCAPSAIRTDETRDPAAAVGKVAKRVSPVMKLSIDPVLVVGAGLAGLTAAYELNKLGIPVRLFEGSANHVGGRVETQTQFNSDGMFCELGAELVDTGHTDLQALAKELGVELEALKPEDASIESDVFYIDGQVYYGKDLLQGLQRFMARLNNDLKSLYRGKDREMITYKNHSLYDAKRFDRMTLGEYLKKFTEVDHWVVKVIEVAYITEYGLETDQQSALNLLTMIDNSVEDDAFEMYGESDEAYRIKGGSSTLVKSLRERLEKQGVVVEADRKLVGIKEKNLRIELTFEAANGSTSQVSSHFVVSAIPFTTFRQIKDWKKLALSSTKKTAIEKMIYGSNTKFMFNTKAQFWREVQGPVKANAGNLITDLSAQSFWETSRKQTGTQGIMTNFLGGSRARRHKVETEDGLIDQFLKVYPTHSAKVDGKRVRRNWFEQPWQQGSYASLGPSHFTTFHGAAGESELNHRLYFCGEHCSIDYQGFMNGAIETGKIVAAEISTRIDEAKELKRRKSAS